MYNKGDTCAIGLDDQEDVDQRSGIFAREYGKFRSRPWTPMPRNGKSKLRRMKSKLEIRVPRVIHTENLTALLAFHTGTCTAIPGLMPVLYVWLKSISSFSNLYIIYILTTSLSLIPSLQSNHVSCSRRFGYSTSYILPNSFDSSQPNSIKRQISHSAALHSPNRSSNIQGTIPPSLSPLPSSLYPLQIQQFITWGWAIFEILFYLRVVLPITSPTPFVTSIICLPPQPNIRLTPFFIIGVIAVILGTYIRLDCFKTLGHLFTFDLTIHPEHRLITSRFYAYVRHPAYTGSLLLVFGLAFSHLTRGSWMRECGPLRASSSAIVVWALWWLWTLSVGISRADAEDKQMRKLFPEEWDAYAAAVHWWFFPGII